MSCCSASGCETGTGKNKAICPQCGQAAKRVDKITVVHMVRNPFLKQVADEPHYFCAGPECDTVYFSEGGGRFTREQIRVHVGEKENGPSRHVCYCFDYTEEAIFAEIEETGTSTVADDITAKIKDGLCACEVKNPSGNCCLGRVRATIKKGLQLAAVEN